MSETLPGYGPLPDPPPIDVMALQSRIAMYLHAKCGDPQGRRLLEEASIALLQTEQTTRRTQRQTAATADRIETLLAGFILRVDPVLRTVERCISDGK